MRAPYPAQSVNLAPEGADASAGLVRLLARLGEPQPQDPSAHQCGSPGPDQPDPEEELS
jgi:hypothetical protein